MRKSFWFLIQNSQSYHTHPHLEALALTILFILFYIWQWIWIFLSILTKSIKSKDFSKCLSTYLGNDIFDLFTPEIYYKLYFDTSNTVFIIFKLYNFLWQYSVPLGWMIQNNYFLNCKESQTSSHGFFH